MVRMLKWVSVLAFVLASFLTFAVSDGAPTLPGAIRGVVVDAAGQPVAGAVVSLNLPDRPAVQVVRTNERGLFAFDRVRPGRYGVVAKKRDVGVGAVRVAVRSGEVVRVRIELTR